VRVRAEKDENGKDIESLFAKELKRRGLSPSSSVDLDSDIAAREAAGPSAETSAKSPFQSATKTSARTTQESLPSIQGQRERSFALVNEGLEGLIPRATELLKLGGSVFLAFVPFILAISLLFGGIYMVMGDHFVHGGDANSGPPAYVDPNTLLGEPTVDPYVPYLQ